MSRYVNNVQCLVVGAGLAGLVAATELRERGISTLVLDKGRSVGGRLATRRIGEAVFDHGAQFFTVRDGGFSELVKEWISAGVVEEWCQGFATAERGTRTDGHPRYRGTGGMIMIAKYLAQKLDVRVDERVVALNLIEGKWNAGTDKGDVITSDAVLLTPPVPQSRALVEAGNFKLPEEARTALERIEYDSCIAVMCVLEGASALPPPGGVQMEEGAEPIYWIADNQQKGISPRQCGITIHTGAGFSRDYYEAADEAITNMILANARPWLGESAVQDVQVKRWRYSKPIVLHPQRCLAVEETNSERVSKCGAPLVFAGDAFGGARVEGAALSGLAAADKLIRMLS